MSDIITNTTSTNESKVFNVYVSKSTTAGTALVTRGSLNKTDTAPTVSGLYVLEEIGIYPNLGNIDAQAGKLNFASFDGTTWSLIEVELSLTKQLFNPEDNVNPSSMKAAATYIDAQIDIVTTPAIDVNLFENSAVSARGNWANYLSGLLQSATDNPVIEDIRRSDFIKILPNTDYSRKFGFDPIIGDVGTVFYDKNKTYIGYTFDKSFTSPNNAYYAVVNVSNDNYLDELLVRGNIAFKNQRNIPVGKNLFDINSISEVNYWVNWQLGIRDSYPTNPYIQYFHYSGLIPIIPNTTYTRRFGSYGTSFFDEKMDFISGVASNTFTTPNKSKYVILNTHEMDMYEQLELGAKSTYYAKFGELNHIKYCLNLPNKIYAVKGVEANVYLDNLMIDDAVNYNWNIDCNVGKQQNERFSVIPTDTSTQALVFNVFDKGDDLYDIATMATSSLVIASETAGSGQTKKYLQIGDSTTFQMMELNCLQEVFENDGLTITQIGTQGVYPSKNEGHPSKGTDFIFSDALSPFVFGGSFNFSQYMSTNGFSDVDYVTLAMGVNDMYGMGRDSRALAKIADCMTKYDAMVTSIKAFNPNIKIGVLISILPTYNQDAFIFASAQHRWRQKRNMQLWANELINRYSNRESENIYVVPYATSLDCQNNYTESLESVNSHNPKQVNRQNNSLHPDKSGYLQLADSVRAWIKNNI